MSRAASSGRTLVPPRRGLRRHTRSDFKPTARAASSVRVIVFGFPHVMLGIKFEAELGDEIELGLKIIDVLFLVVHELLEQVAAHVVLHRMTMGRGLLVERARRHLGRKIAVEYLLHVLPDVKRVDHCMLGNPSRKMVRSTILSACCISSIDSWRHFLA